MSRVLLAVLLLSGAVAAQQPGTAPTTIPTESSLVATTWTALSRGDVAGSGRALAELKRRYPRSTQALGLSVEVGLLRGGPAVALDEYDRWAGTRRPAEPLILRRIAEAVLVEASQPGRPLRVEALAALAVDGDQAVRATLVKAAQGGSVADARALAELGDPDGVRQAAAALALPVPNKISLVDALVASRSAEAIPALAAMLDDPRSEHQAAAAAALGRLGARDSLPRLQALWQNPASPPYVRMAVAGALVDLQDNSGLDQLQAWMRSEVPAMRLGAARALSSRPDADWTAVVRGLTAEADPIVSLDAATLMAPHDPDLARSTFARLAQSPDSAVRQMAGAAEATKLPADLRQITPLLRAVDAVRVPAARRVLELTR